MPPQKQDSPGNVIDRLIQIVGAPYVLTEPSPTYTQDWRKMYQGRPLCVVRPANTAEVSAVVHCCQEAGVSIVPQAGNTGLAGGGIPDDSGKQVILTVNRLNRIRTIDPINHTMTVEAGCILQTIQEKAEEAHCLFPLSLAAEGSCCIGGNIATNAGGVQVLRYGNTRSLVLGLEVVLASGEIWHGLRGLRKDNTGYDLKQLFIGSEGTLGIITAAVLQLFPAPLHQQVSLLGVNDPQGALALLQHAKSQLGDRIVAFEIMSAESLGCVIQEYPSLGIPMPDKHPWYVLMECNDHSAQANLSNIVQTTLEEALEKNIIEDATLAKNLQEAQQIWQLRESIPLAQARIGHNIKHDISLPISSIPVFLDKVWGALNTAYPGLRPVIFGHLGDGNLHYNLMPPAEGWTDDLWMKERPAVNRIVHDQVALEHGSISAEHGLGQLRNEEIHRYKSAVEIAMMREIKRSLDPHNVMNPGKMISPAPSSAPSSIIN